MCPFHGQGGNTCCSKTPRKLSGFRGVLLFVKNGRRMSCHFCRARAPFYALRGVMGSLGAEIPAGFYGMVETRSPAEGSAARATGLVGAVMQANRVLYAANVVRGWRDLHAPHEFAILHSDSLRAACGGCSLDAHCGRYLNSPLLDFLPKRLLCGLCMQTAKNIMR